MSSALPDDGFAAPDEHRPQGFATDKDKAAQGKQKKKGRGCLYAILVVIALGVLGRFACERLVSHFIVSEPQDVARQAGLLADYKLPVDYKGAFSAHVPKVGQFSIFAKGLDKDGEVLDEAEGFGLIVLAGLQIRLSDQDLLQQLNDMARQGTGAGSKNGQPQQLQSDADVPVKCKLAELDALCMRARMRDKQDPDKVVLLWQAAIVQQGDETFVAAMADKPDNFNEQKWSEFRSSLRPHWQ